MCVIVILSTCVSVSEVCGCVAFSGDCIGWLCVNLAVYKNASLSVIKALLISFVVQSSCVLY